MAKAINWPAAFRDEVIGEGTDDLRVAVRLGRLYYDNQYWVDGETVLVRVDHKIVRTAQICGPTKCCPIQALSAEDYAAQKQSLQTMAALIQFLGDTYQQPVTPETEVTVVYYRNHPLNPDRMDVQDDPHMMATP